MIAAPSSRFTAALPFSHTAVTRVTCLGGELEIESGSLTLNAKGNVRASGSLTAVAQWDSSVITSLTTGSWLRIERGIAFPDGTSEFVLLATVQVQEISVDERARNARVAFSDAGQGVEDYPILSDWQPVDAAGAQLTVSAAIRLLIDAAVPSLNGAAVVYSMPANATTTMTPAGMVVKAGTGRWKAVTDLAALVGCTVAQFDPAGVLTVAALPTSPSPVVVWATGDGGVLVRADTSGSRRETYNAVAIEYGDGSAEGGTVFLVDADASSPTFWNGSWGRRPKPLERVPAATLADAQAVAAQRLAESRGLAVGISVDAVWNPLLEPRDAVSVGGSAYVLDQITMPLVGGVMSVSGRRVS